MTRKRRLALILLAAAALAAAGWFALRPGDPPPAPLPPRMPRRGEPVTDVPVKPVREAGDALPPAELVLGVVIGREARAYPVSLLNSPPQRKVVNDTLGGRAIAATW